MLANCLNLPCRDFKQFACFSDAFKSSFKKKKKCKIFLISQSHVEFFLDALTVPPHVIFVIFFPQHFLGFFVLICPFGISLLSDQITCGYVPPKLFSHLQH